MIQRYAGFWVRLSAALLDALLMFFVSWPLLLAIYGVRYSESNGLAPLGVWDFFITWVLPPAAIILFWLVTQSTPGKMVWSARIVDADTGDAPQPRQVLIRCAAYLISALPFFVGFLWVAVDRKKQGWHDKLANTLVVR